MLSDDASHFFQRKSLQKAAPQPSGKVRLQPLGLGMPPMLLAVTLASEANSKDAPVEHQPHLSQTMLHDPPTMPH